MRLYDSGIWETCTIFFLLNCRAIFFVYGLEGIRIKLVCFHSSTHSFNKYLFSGYSEPGTGGSGDTAMTQTARILVSELTV